MNAAGSWISSAALMSALALVFTVGSFWWIHARRGKLVTYEPHTFAAYVRAKYVRFRFPLALYNDGPVPIVIQDLRLILEHGVELQAVPWQGTKQQLMPVNGDSIDLPAVFAVDGRKVLQIFAEFGASKSVPAIEPVTYIAHVEARIDDAEHWAEILSFPFRAGNILEPGHFITYGNAEDSLTAEERIEAKRALEKVTAQRATSSVSSEKEETGP
ncbi:hypothetical protein ACQEVF_47385 [Nonomuraea polychroma]|uniref:hypothetical protein n=1 Tax=Nonomuraea polychroma TaxID=46176 RepID=UPI003D94C59D